METLIKPEEIKLKQLEGIIERGQKTFVEVGLALAEIRDRRLYKATHKTFEAYCAERWGYRRRYAYDLIMSSEAVKALPENVRNCAQNESQARAIKNVEPAEREKVIEKAAEKAKAEKRPVTARDIKDAALDTKGAVAPKGPKDEVGRVIPDPCLPVWSKRAEVCKVLDALGIVRGYVRKHQDDLHMAEVTGGTTMMHLDAAYQELQQGVPYAVCSKCQGKLPKNCDLCLEKGMISEHKWTVCVPEEFKKMIQKT